MARTQWDWDEILFSHAMRDFDIALHHPHPPGFPVYVGAAKLLRFLIDSDFRALQAVNLIAGIFLFPAMYALGRAVGCRFQTSILAGALLAFFPNVWFFGGSAFSDIPSLTLAVFGLAFLFRGWQSRNAYWLGTFLLALSMGIRPQNLLIGLFAGGVATIVRARTSWRDVFVAVLIGAGVVAAAYGGAMMAGDGPGVFFDAVRGHSQYITAVDSFRSPDRPALWRLFHLFFVRQYQSPVLSGIITIFVIISAVGSIRERSRPIGSIVASFAPFAIMAWLMLDRYSISRFSIGYAPMFAFLAADGIARATRRHPRIEWAAGSLLIAAFIAFTLPELSTVRNQVTPPVQAAQAARRTIDPERHDFRVAFNMAPYVDYFAPELDYILMMDDRSLPLASGPRQPVLLAEMTEKPGGQLFRRRRGALWNIARHHYFEVVLKPIPRVPRFVSGWYEPERSHRDEFRWMGATSVMLLPPASGDTLLQLEMFFPPGILAEKPTLIIKLNGRLLERLTPRDAVVTHKVHVEPAGGGAENVLELSMDRTIWDAGTARDRALRLRWLSWGPG